MLTVAYNWTCDLCSETSLDQSAHLPDGWSSLCVEKTDKEQKQSNVKHICPDCVEIIMRNVRQEEA